MQRVETGTTGERQIRCLIFALMCTAFSAYFAYDGWIGYPKKNLEDAKKNLPDRIPEEGIKTNPSVTVANIESLRAALAAGEPMTDTNLKERLGAPCWVQDTPQERYYIGPALFCKIKMAGNQVVSFDQVIENRDRSEKTIRGQKVFAVVVSVVVVIALIQLIRIVRTKVVLDDAGLTYNGKLVSWDAMTALDTERYHEKGWVDLEYKAGDATDVRRIDNYKVKAFKEIVSAICERKGFASPFKSDSAGA
jgi:hypothetical protein